MSKTPEVRIKVNDLDRLMKLTWGQERVWMYYKRREGADGKAFGKAQTIADWTGVTPGGVRNLRAWLVKHGWLKPNGRSRVGLPMFLAVIPRLHPEADQMSSQDDTTVIAGLHPMSSQDDTEVPTLKEATSEGFGSPSRKEESKEPLAPLAQMVVQVEEQVNTPSGLLDDGSITEETPTPKPNPLHWRVPHLEKFWIARTQRSFTEAEAQLASDLIFAHRYRVVEAVLTNTLWKRPASAKLRWNKFAIFAKHWERNHEEYLAWCVTGEFDKTRGSVSKTPITKFDAVPDPAKMTDKHAEEWKQLVQWLKDYGKDGEWEMGTDEWKDLGVHQGHVYVVLSYIGEEGMCVTKDQFTDLLCEAGHTQFSEGAVA